MNCIIIEDEIPAQRILKNYIRKIPDLNILASFQTATLANEYLKQESVDVVLLDINLPDISGIDFIKTVKKPPQIIITTAYPEFAVDSFELTTIVDYLVKPFSFDRFLKAISKAENRINHQEKTQKKAIFLNIDKTIHKVYTEDISYIESDRNYVTFFTQNKKLSVIDSLKKWAEILSPKQFVQIHKSYIINIKKIEKYSGSSVFINKQKLPLGRTYKNSFSESINSSKN